MHFNTFPDDCILYIFSRLPLHNLLRVEIVCRKWQSLQQVACRQRHSLLLLVGSGALDYAGKFYDCTTPFGDVLMNEDGTHMFVSHSEIVKWHGLNFAELSKPICKKLVDKLPNISSLQITIAFEAYTMTHPVLSLLTGWSSKLVTLKLLFDNTAGANEYFGDIEPKVQQEIAQDCWFLLGALNCLVALKNLTLDIGVLFLGPDQMQRNSRRISLPILSQLDQFDFCSYDQPDVILDSLVRYGEPNANLRQIGVYDKFITEECLDKFVKLSPELRSRFTHLLPLLSPCCPDVLNYDFDPGLDTICSKFSSQTNLQFSNDSDISFSKIINTLSSLKQLLFLGLEYALEFDEFHFSDPSILNCSIAQLSSVKVLYLDIYITSHTHLSQMNIPWAFPNLQALEIVFPFNACDECGLEDTQEISNEKYRECATIMLEPLKKCTRLCSIKLGMYDDNLKIGWINVDDIIEKIINK